MFFIFLRFLAICKCRKNIRFCIVKIGHFFADACLSRENIRYLPKFWFVMRYIFILFLMSASLLASAQKEDYVWIFGGNKIDFNNNPPTVTALGDFFKTDRNISTVSDSKGNLCYWCSGKDFYNRHNEVIFSTQVVSHGYCLETLSIVPFPASDQMFLFTYIDRRNNKVRFALIDGRNDLDHPDCNDNYFALPYDYSSGDGMPVFIQKRNSRDMWMLHDYEGEVTVYLISESGFEKKNTYQRPDMGNWEDTQPWQAYFVNNDNSKFLCDIICDWNNPRYQYVEFDNATGEIQKMTIIETSDYVVFCQFTPNGKYMYYTLSSSDESKSKRIYRCPASRIDGTSASLRRYSEYVCEAPDYIWDIKLAPDGNIYFIYANCESLGVIKNPDDYAPVIDYNYLPLAQPFPKQDMVMVFTHTYHHSLDIICKTSCTMATLQCVEDGVKTYEWDFGDGSAKSSEPEPSHNYPDFGDYTVKLRITYSDDSHRDITQKINVANNMKAPAVKWKVKD